jgi:mannose-1-phosphate guanylyltransferase/mannose-6-phosphate isomerase
MIVVIIAGGSGTRLWPLSTPDYPKHLLKVNSDKLSLVQQTYKRALRLTDKIYVASEAGHVDEVKEQLPDLPDEAFIVEPARRGTANCIIEALARVSAEHGDDEEVAFLSADHYIRDVRGFIHSFQLAVKTSKQQNRIVLIGIEPTGAATGFGYIKKGEVLDQANLVFNVAGFKEKPDRSTAQEYVRSGEYLWNAGYFVGTAAVFKKAMKQHAPQLFADYEKLAKASPDAYADMYKDLKTISIDYALIEKVPDLLVVPATFDWMDLGSFSDLHRAIGGDEKGNYFAGRVEAESVQNTVVYNLEDKPVAVIGLDNVAVVNTPNGVLIVRKDMSQKVGEVSKRLLDSD